MLVIAVSDVLSGKPTEDIEDDLEVLRGKTLEEIAQMLPTPPESCPLSPIQFGQQWTPPVTPIASVEVPTEAEKNMKKRLHHATDDVLERAKGLLLHMNEQQQVQESLSKKQCPSISASAPIPNYFEEFIYFDKKANPDVLQTRQMLLCFVPSSQVCTCVAIHSPLKNEKKTLN